MSLTDHQLIDNNNLNEPMDNPCIHAYFWIRFLWTLLKDYALEALLSRHIFFSFLELNFSSSLARGRAARAYECVCPRESAGRMCVSVCCARASKWSKGCECVCYCACMCVRACVGGGWPWWRMCVWGGAAVRCYPNLGGCARVHPHARACFAERTCYPALHLSCPLYLLPMDWWLCTHHATDSNNGLSTSNCPLPNRHSIHLLPNSIPLHQMLRLNVLSVCVYVNGWGVFVCQKKCQPATMTDNLIQLIITHGGT